MWSSQTNPGSRALLESWLKAGWSQDHFLSGDSLRYGFLCTKTAMESRFLSPEGKQLAGIYIAHGKRGYACALNHV